jgi:alpha-tubulin suppressor-like RCC1 family protein
VWAWGFNYAGALGDGTLETRYTPAQVQGMTGVVAVAAGNQSSLALRTDGTGWGWGNNSCGQIGNEPGVRLTPAQVQGLSGVVSVSATNDLSVAVRGDGSVWFFGCTWDVWDLGPQPQQVPGLTNITMVAVNTFGGLTAVRSDGTVWQWSIQDLLTGTPPRQLEGFTDAVAVAYSQHTLQVVRSDGTVWNQGENHLGERGFASEALTPAGPSQVPGLTGVVSVSNAPWLVTVHALLGNGTVVGWGSNEGGRLGLGISPLHLEPTQVPLPCRLKVQGTGPGEPNRCAAAP